MILTSVLILQMQLGFPLDILKPIQLFFCFETSTVNEPPDSGKERLAHMKATQVTDAQGGEQLTFPACHGPTAKHMASFDWNDDDDS